MNCNGIKTHGSNFPAKIQLYLPQVSSCLPVQRQYIVNLSLRVKLEYLMTTQDITEVYYEYYLSVSTDWCSRHSVILPLFNSKLTVLLEYFKCRCT